MSARAAAVVVGLGLALGGSAWAQTPWTAPESEKSKKSPIAASAKVAEQGKKVAQVNCVSCHGKGGKGDGAAAVALNPKPADWTSKKIQERERRRALLENHDRPGRHAGWRHLPENDRWALVHYIRTLKK